MTKVIVLEGMDGTGKTFVARDLVRQLNKDKPIALLVREPGGTETGEAIRKLLLGTQPLEPLSQFYLFQVARIELLKALAKIKDQYKYIIFDRSYPSTYAYQVHGDRIAHSLYLEAMEDISPYMKALGEWQIFLLVLPEAERQARLQASGKGGERYEDKPADYLERVRHGYNNVAVWSDVKVISASDTLGRIVDCIKDSLD